MDENILNEIVSYFPNKFKFNTFQFVSKEFHAFVWNPNYNRLAIFDFERRPSIDVKLLNRKSITTLLSPGGIWSNLSSVKLVGLMDNCHISLVHDLTSLRSLEHIEITRSQPNCVKALIGGLRESHSLLSLVISEVEMETVEDIDVWSLRLPHLTTLVLNEVFVIHSPGSGPCSPSGQGTTASLYPSCIERMDIYVGPFPELLNLFQRALSTISLSNLTYLRIRCPTAPSHPDKLASVISAKVNVNGWPSLAQLEVGFVNSSLIHSLRDRCPAVSRISFSDRVDASLGELACAFPQVVDLTLRVKHDGQLQELVHVFMSTSWRHSVDHLKVIWTVVNSMSIETLIALRVAVGLKFFHCSPRSLVASDSLCVRRESYFCAFFDELCRDRIVCECDDCGAGTGDVDPLHILEMAQDEWDSLPSELKHSYVETVQKFKLV
jgi:hypothetical protein